MLPEQVIGLKAIAECEGRAVQKNGKPYNNWCASLFPPERRTEPQFFFFDNRYCWIMHFHPESGKIIKLREYLNTALVREVHEATDNV